MYKGCRGSSRGTCSYASRWSQSICDEPSTSLPLPPYPPPYVSLWLSVGRRHCTGCGGWRLNVWDTGLPMTWGRYRRRLLGYHIEVRLGLVSCRYVTFVEVTLLRKRREIGLVGATSRHDWGFHRGISSNGRSLSLVFACPSEDDKWMWCETDEGAEEQFNGFS